MAYWLGLVGRRALFNRPPTTGMSLSPDVLVLPAFTVAEYTGEASELAPWLDRYEFDQTREVPGVQYPLRIDTETSLALAATGIGKSAAATTVTALAAGEQLDLSETTIMSVGIAGCRPASGTLGSVFIADHVVDWDIKLRIGETIQPMQWLVDEYVWEIDEPLATRALQAAEGVDLVDSQQAAEIRAHYDDTRQPTVEIGTTVCGDEVYHGTATATQVESLCDSYGVEGFATTEMEDAGTVTALERFGLLDQYLSIRAAANFDREPAGGEPTESIDRDVFDLGIENAARVGQAVVEEFTAKK